MGGRNGKASGVRCVWCSVCNLEIDANFLGAGALSGAGRDPFCAPGGDGRNSTGYCGTGSSRAVLRKRQWWPSMSSHHLPRGVPSRWRAVRRTLARANAAKISWLNFKAAVPGGLDFVQG